jgi:prepilin-type N-terminal cleavage/methylation domain-containing protein
MCYHEDGDPSRSRESAFTLIELLVVVLIVGVVFVLVAPVVLRGSIANREAARLIHGALVGAHDAAIGKGSPRGIRLVPDPAFPVTRLANGQIDPSTPLCCSRIIPIEPAPDYSEGRVTIHNLFFFPFPGFPPPYLGSKSQVYPYPSQVLMVEEAPVDLSTGLTNSPTAWFWNIRIGDRIRFGASGQWYTVVGPMTTYNAELFVNCGTPGVDFPGVKSPLKRFYNGLIEVDFLFLVNGRDDNNNGLIDEGFDGLDNNLDGVVDDLGEWESELWIGREASGSTMSYPYTIARRPCASHGAGVVQLPSSVVIDLSTWGTTRERSRLPVNALSGEVDIMITPRGDVVPTTIYSSPASVGLQNSLLHVWIGDRGDVFDPRPGVYPQLPLPQGLTPASDGRELKGDITILSMNTRTGFISTTNPSQFDTAHLGTPAYNANLPFLACSRTAP